MKTKINEQEIMRMTPIERVKALEGEPQSTAKKIQNGFMQRVIWEYRGYQMRSRKNPGWNSGSDWHTFNHPTQNYSAQSKLQLMLKIDRELAKAGDESQSDWQLFNEKNNL